jgi:GH25 family lysozyme M1 (1,4-beta-N-acetylmuramidase)
MIIGLDINAFYQEQEQFGRFIDWRALKADPLNFRFIWIKAGEGTDDIGYVAGAARCVTGAKSVAFEAINPYHYYLFQLFDVSTNTWYVLPAVDQAQAFYNAASVAGFSLAHPMTDIEDPLIDQFLRWTDTASANRAIAFARKLNAHLRAYHQAITDVFGVRPDIYTGKWWLDKFCLLLILNGYRSDLDWMKDYKFVLADYDGTLNIPDYISTEQVIAWQETSSPVPDVKGIPTGRVRQGDALDIDRWMQSEEKFLEWCGKVVVPPVPAPGLTLESLDARLKLIEKMPWYKINLPLAMK